MSDEHKTETPGAAPAAPSPAATPSATEVRGHRKERVGEVLPSKMTKTIVVRVERRFPHPQYRKVIKSYKKFYAHDEKGEARPGDVVRIEETRPISKLKRWRLVEVVERTAIADPVTA
jgi:small subunit ribosomal protein S17